MISRFIVLTGLVASTALAADAVDKSKYNIFNPTPKELMREMSTDRPDKTESPYTIDAGHFQIESDLAIFAFDHDRAGGADTHTTDWAVTTLNLTAGLCNYSDFQLVLFPYSRYRGDDRLAGA